MLIHLSNRLFLVGMWTQWQHAAAATDNQSMANNVIPHQPQEMDMMQMLGQQDQNTFEDLNMFNSFNE